MVDPPLDGAVQLRCITASPGVAVSVGAAGAVGGGGGGGGASAQLPRPLQRSKPTRHGAPLLPDVMSRNGMLVPYT